MANKDAAEVPVATPAVHAPAKAKTSAEVPGVPPQRWLMLAILSFDICVNYLPYYTFVPIMKQSMQLYGVDEAALNKLCIVFAIVYVPGAFVTDPLVKYLGCKWTFVIGTALTVLGCIVRCGPDFTHGLVAMLRNDPASPAPFVDTHGTELLIRPGALDFNWLLVGQLFCAMGQPLLCNPTSEMGAEWFPSSERPAAAMVLNLMHFIGSSASFMLPPVLVDEELHDTNADALTFQMAHVLRFQLGLALLAFTLTVTMYQSRPRLPSLFVHRSPASFVGEARRILSDYDFWVVNVQFALFVGVCHAFDAVEGSLLEYYGYNASLTSWTAVSCAITSIIATVLEARVITSPVSYRKALLAANAFLAGSQLLGFFCLFFQCHRYVFVFAVGIMGLGTPGFGCSCELGVEVCYPGREATVTSFLEAFSNLFGVFSIIFIQWLLDAGLGASVLLVTGGFSAAGGGLLLLMSNRLRRMEAEEEAGADSDDFDEEPKPVFAAHHLAAPSGARRLHKSLSIAAIVAATLSAGRLMLVPPAAPAAPLAAPPVLAPQAQAGAATSPASLPAAATSPQKAIGPPTAQTLNLSSPQPTWLHEPATVVIQCSYGDKMRFVRCKKYLKLAGVSFEVVKCNSGTPADVERAVRDGLVLPSAVKAQRHGFTRKGQKRDSILAAAITHLRIMQLVAEGNASFVNVIYDTEVVSEAFLKSRAALLGRLPKDVDFINLNARRPSGQRVRLPKKIHLRVFKMIPGLSPRLNRWLGNYVVSPAGARKILAVGSEYDSLGAWEAFDEFLLSRLFTALPPEMGGFLGFAVQTNVVSYRCKEQGEKNSKCKY